MIYEYDNWNKDSILDRGRKLFEKINEIWPVPKGKNLKQEESEITSDTFYAVYDPITVTGMKPLQLLITDDEYSITSWKQALITYLEWLADFDMEQYLELPQQKSFQKLLSYTGELFRKPEQVYTIYVETNLSAQGIYNYMSSLAEFYNMEDDVYIRLNVD